jgi:competence ComEA-like helix-hairpin-helix protein
MKNKKTVMALCIALVFAGAFIFGGMAAGQTNAPAKINLNKATPEQLSKCPGLTPALAQAIVEQREKAGSFKTPEDLLKIKGITKEILNRLNPKLDKGILYLTPAAPSPDEDEEEPSLKPSKC